VVEPFKDPMANQAAGPQQGRINFCGGTVDRADDMQAEKIGEQAVGKVQDSANQFAVVGTTRHQCRIGVFQNDDELLVGMALALLRPELDEFCAGQNLQIGSLNKVEAMRFPEYTRNGS